MLSSTLQTILDRMISEFDIDENVLKKILYYVYDKEINSYVYPELIEEKFDIDLNICFRICMFLEKRNLLKRVYKLYCPRCLEFSENMFDNFNELEEFSSCADCGKNLIDKDNPYKYIFIYFKVIKGV